MKLILKLSIIVVFIMMAFFSGYRFYPYYNLEKLSINEFHKDTLRVNISNGKINVKNLSSPKSEISSIGIIDGLTSYYYKKTDSNKVYLFFNNNGNLEKLKDYKKTDNESFINFCNSEYFLINKNRTQCLVIEGCENEYVQDSIYEFSFFSLTKNHSKYRLNISPNGNYEFKIENNNVPTNNISVRIKFTKSGEFTLHGTYEPYNYLNFPKDTTEVILIQPFTLKCKVK